GPKLDGARNVIQRQAQTLARMVDDLLDISRMERGTVTLRREPVEVAAVIAQAAETTRAAFEAKRQRLHVDLLAEPVILHADMTRLVQVVANLLSNATKFTGEGGEIWLGSRRDGDQIEVRVRDTG